MTTATFTLNEAALITLGSLKNGDKDSRFQGVCIDSRQVKPGQAFVAIVGLKFDGHDFLQQAISFGASLLIVEKNINISVPKGVGVLQVSSTRRALGALANYCRRHIGPKVVAITGSMGKTTTKEFVTQILQTQGMTHCNKGNFNNDIGLPLTLLSMPISSKFLVSEMGMNAPKEIAYLTKLAEPDIGVITNIAPVHLEGLGSIEAIAKAKAELLEELGPNAMAVVPGNEILLKPYLEKILSKQWVTFGWETNDDVCICSVRCIGMKGSEVELNLQGTPVQFYLPLPGKHNVVNAAAAAAVGICLNIEPKTIAKALSILPTLDHRSQVLKIGQVHLLDDCYNANPQAMKAAIDTVLELAGKSNVVAVLGTMRELGKQADKFHFELGQYVAACDVASLITVGKEAFLIAKGAKENGMNSDQVIPLEDPKEAAQIALKKAGANGWILVKGSRGARLEYVVEHLKTLIGQQEKN